MYLTLSNDTRSRLQSSHCFLSKKQKTASSNPFPLKHFMKNSRICRQDFTHYAFQQFSMYEELNLSVLFLLEAIYNSNSTSETALIIFQSSLAIPGGVTATLVCWARPSVFTYVAAFSVYAAPGRIMSAMGAPTSP